MLRVLLIAIALLLSFAAHAQEDNADKATARQLFHEAGEAMSGGDYAKAADLYARSNALYPAPTAALGEARALVKLGRLVDASERYFALMKTDLGDKPNEAFVQAVEDAKSERKLVVERIAGLVISLDGDSRGVRVTLDGLDVASASLGVKRLVDPGPHVVKAHVAGKPDVVREVELEEGQVLDVVLPIEKASEPPAPSPEPAPERETPPETVEADAPDTTQRSAGFALIGIGAASLVVAIITGAIYLDAKSTIDEHCNDQLKCTQTGIDAVEQGETVGLVNAVTLIGGLAIAGTGIVVLLTAPSNEDDTSEVALQPLLGPGLAGIGASVRF